MTTVSREREFFGLRPSLLGAFGLLDLSGLYGWDVQFALIPWRGCALGVGLLLAGGAVLPRFTINEAVLFTSSFLLLVVPIGLEVLNRRDVVTESAFVRQRGILGHVRHSIHLAQIDRVEYSFPRWGRYWNVGDVIIRTLGGRTVLRGIKRPAAVAQLILDAKARSLGVRGESVDV